MNAAAVLTDTLYLNASGNSNAVFVIQVNGALSTSTYAKVLLINGAQAKNVFWKIEGAADISDYSIFAGTIICNNASVSLSTGVNLNGRAMTTTGTITTAAVIATIPSACTITDIATEATGNAAVLYPNPFNSSITIVMDETSRMGNTELRIYNTLGAIVMNADVTKQTTTIATDHLTSGIYFYNVIKDGRIIQSGNIISQQ
jgi:hypothetical protein